ncbi:SMI1/KNR4 family protein [Danxiaibacter flavus]|uniref:SMI1/KNR4 family protein n=1 Tax=Danxiaibacter flavus TaxID=3049108 RepID=UPI0034E0B206
MPIINLIESISKKHYSSGIEIYPPATLTDIKLFEQKIGFALPREFREFYSICNGFGCNEDIFNIVSLADTMRHPQDYGTNWFYFAEYMIYSDMWGLRLSGG